MAVARASAAATIAAISVVQRAIPTAAVGYNRVREVKMLALMLTASMAVAQASAPPVISPAQAVNHVGEEVVVRGQITQIVLSVNLTTHINFGGIYPNHVFTATIMKANQKLFPHIRDLDGKLVHVQGLVHLYRGKPEIVLTRPTQIRAAD